MYLLQEIATYRWDLHEVYSGARVLTQNKIGDIQNDSDKITVLWDRTLNSLYGPFSKKRRIREANRSYVSKILHITEGILETSDPSSMEILQSNVALLKEKSDSLKNLDRRILWRVFRFGKGNRGNERICTSYYGYRLQGRKNSEARRSQSKGTATGIFRWVRSITFQCEIAQTVY